MADMAWHNNDFLIEDGDIKFLADSVLQELVLRINTMKNEHYMVKTYGCDIYKRIGALNNLETQLLVAEDLEDAMRQDPRIGKESVRIVFLPTSVLTCDLYYNGQSTNIEVS
jgi:hypothetical protein